jgi:V/A-type H+/Na+-transporting ATPase subunit E
MTDLKSGKDKIQSICDELRKNTLEPAHKQAQEIIENAEVEAALMINNAREHLEEMKRAADQAMQQKTEALQASLQTSCRQAIDRLKASIEQKILFHGLIEMVSEELSNSSLIANWINHFMKILEEKGIDEEITVTIPSTLSPRLINSLLVRHFLEHLKDKTVVLGDFAGGVKMKLHNRRITIDISDQAVRELIAETIRHDFRDFVFG